MTPKEWTKVGLKSFIELISGQHIKAEDYNHLGDGIPYLTGPADFPNGEIIVSKFTTKPKAVCEKGDILITVKGSGTGKLIVADGVYCISRQLMAIRPRNISKDYLYYSLLAFEEQHNSNAAGLIPGISRDDVFNTTIYFTTDKVQEVIGKILLTWDEAIEKLEKLIEAKKLRKKGLMQQLFTGKKRFDGFDREWTSSKLGDLGLDISDGNYSSKYPKQKDFINKGIPFIRANNIKNLTVISKDMRYISKEQHSDLTKGHVKKNDILITNRGDVGELALVPDEFIGSNLNAQVVRINSGEKVNHLFLLEFLHYFKEVGKLEAFTTGSALKQLPINRLKQILIKTPSLSEQKKIGDFLYDLDKEIVKLKSEKDLWLLQKKGLMQQLLTGKKRVKVD